MGRSPCCSKDEGLNRGAWTAHEDQLLTRYIDSHGVGKWRNLPKKAGLNRCGKSCRLRWLNYLRPDIKRGNISPDEEDLIIRLHKLLGNRWSLIAGRLPGRTDNEIKNYWNTNLGKRVDPQTHHRLSTTTSAAAAHPSKLSVKPRRKIVPPPATATAPVRAKPAKCSKKLVFYPRRQEEEGNNNTNDAGVILAGDGEKAETSSLAAVEASSSSCAPANNGLSGGGDDNSNENIINGGRRDANNPLQGTDELIMTVDFGGEAGAEISLSELLAGCDDFRDLCDFSHHHPHTAGCSGGKSRDEVEMLMAAGGCGEMLISSEEMLEEGWDIDVTATTTAASDLNGFGGAGFLGTGCGVDDDEEWLGIAECSSS
ncbi:unnamed protein product [Linum trigynum]|uniref:Myb-related protein 123 n=1 Tax=Linum trigynum TaxID=586398 RepID=A0AAV2CLM9_9ROSI